MSSTMQVNLFYYHHGNALVHGLLSKPVVTHAVVITGNERLTKFALLRNVNDTIMHSLIFI